MPKKFIVTYFLIFCVILGMLSISHHASDKIRGNSIALMAPVWERLLSFKHFLFNPTEPSPFVNFSSKEEGLRLQLENQLLKIELSEIQQKLDEQIFFSSQMHQIAANAPEEAYQLTKEYQKSLQKSVKVMKERLKGIPARVIFRTLDTWNSALWINVGHVDNENLEEPIVQINSPVILGNAVVGIVDYVGKYQSKIRLISDPRLTPAVRASRGGEQEALLSSHIEYLLHQITNKKNQFLSPDENVQLVKILNELKNNLQPLKKTWYLAKGELLGSLSAHSMNRKVYLKGTGFNYDFSDHEGDSRDLRNGKSLQHPQAAAVQILKVNDILVTTGMDGIFPPGFQVAHVTHIGLLKEGDYFYDLVAEPTAIPLEELSLVFVLPPVSREKIADPK